MMWLRYTWYRCKVWLQCHTRGHVHGAWLETEGGNAIRQCYRCLQLSQRDAPPLVARPWRKGPRP